MIIEGKAMFWFFATPPPPRKLDRRHTGRLIKTKRDNLLGGEWGEGVGEEP
jgi:hypothetical protein